MSFKGIQRSFKYNQINYGNIGDVFPLLCPERELDWLDGWEYKMIHSNTGIIEKDCVFTTTFKEHSETVWQVTQYDKTNYIIEFLRVTPFENVAKINIQLNKISEKKTEAIIEYRYTALNEDQNTFIKTNLEQIFIESMKWWEKSINYYLETGNKLIKK